MYRALIVHNYTYGLQASGFSPLNGPKVDGGHVARALCDPYVGLFEQENVILAEDYSAAEIQKAASKFFRAMGPDDTALFYFSGHGRYKNGRFYLCASDTEVEHLAMAVSNDTLNSIIDDSSARTKIIILDCCHSGAFKGISDADAESLWHDGRYVLMATSAADLAADAPADGLPSPFTKVLVDGLLYGAEDRDNDQRVDLEDLYAYLCKNVSGSVRPGRKWEGAGAVVPIARRAAKRDAKPSETSADGSESMPASVTGSGEIRMQSFLDETTSATGLNPERVRGFRAEMRPDVAQRMPENLSPREFVQRAGLMREDLLTRAGALLFGENPTHVCTSAVVQCARFFGLDRSASAETVHFEGAVTEQLQGAVRFVVDRIQRGEAPTNDAMAQPVYDFSTVAVREVIANAIVHRDYQNSAACVHVRLFENRIEVSNPGRWQSPRLAEGETKAFDEIISDSHRLNFQLARILSWMKMVEGEGAGVPRSVADSRRLGAPMPRASSEEGIVTVTIFPRSSDLEQAVERTGLEEVIHPRGTFQSIRILVLAANPGTTSRLTLDQEAREITEKLRLSQDRDTFELITRWAVRPGDLLPHLNENRPQIVHFSGHGSTDDEIVLFAGTDGEHRESTAALAELFRIMKDDIRIVVLNDCYSPVQAQAISQHIDYVIGIRSPTSDRASIVFAAAFYSALGFRRTVQEAFDQAKAAVMLHGLPDHSMPELIVKPGIASEARDHPFDWTRP